MRDHSLRLLFVGHLDDGGITVSFGRFLLVSLSEDFIVIRLGRVFEPRAPAGLGLVGSRV